jgi:hypothetical protein
MDLFEFIISNGHSFYAYYIIVWYHVSILSYFFVQNKFPVCMFMLANLIGC